MLFAGFNVARRRVLAVRGRRSSASLGNLVGSWIAYAVGYYGRIELLEKHGNKLHIKPSHLAAGRPLVRALRRRDGLLHPHAADRPHVHLAARRRRADAVLALHRLHARSAASRGSSCSRSSASRPATTGRTGRTACTTSTTPWPALIVVGVVYLVVRWRRGRRRRRPMPPREPTRPALPLRHALALGLLHGPGRAAAGLLLRPHRARALAAAAGPTRELDPELRKAFEVALHAGTAAALLIALRDEVARGGARARPRAGSRCSRCRSRPPARSRSLFERPIERRLGTPGDDRRRAASLGALAMALRRPRGRSSARATTPARATRSRSASAQACALVPGVSRNGATLAAARARASRARTRTRSRATSRCRSSSARPALKGARLARRGLPPRVRRRSRSAAARLVRLDARLDVADPPGRARPLARALRGLPARRSPRSSCGGGERAR